MHQETESVNIDGVYSNIKLSNIPLKQVRAGKM